MDWALEVCINVCVLYKERILMGVCLSDRKGYNSTCMSELTMSEPQHPTRVLISY